MGRFFDRGAGRLLKLICVALGTQKLSAKLPFTWCFPLVFMAVYAADTLLVGNKDESLFVEDIVKDLFFYGLLGYLSHLLNQRLWIYTAKSAGPTVPALLWALLDDAWKPGKKRRR